MTIGELRKQLERFNDDQTVIFTPSQLCGGGWPEWTEAYTHREMVCELDSEGIEIEVPSDEVTIKLMGERE